MRDISMKNNILFLALLSLAASLNCMEAQIKANIQYILNNKNFEIQHEYGYLIGSIKLYYDNNKIGKASYLVNNKDNRIYLSDYKIAEDFRNKGLGEQFFYLTMHILGKNHPQTTLVHWIIASTIDDTSITLEKSLIKFYRRVGAHVFRDEYLSLKGNINLKDAGYFDEI